MNTTLSRRSTDRAAAIQWAQDVLSDPQAVLLDSETTGLGPSAEPVQIGVLSMDGSVLLDCLIKPKGQIPPEASAIHHIGDQHVAIALRYLEVYGALYRLLRGKRVVVYNAAYDSRILNQAGAAYGFVGNIPVQGWECVMLRYAAFVGDPNTGKQRWNKGLYACHKLPAIAGVDAHSAIADCRATLHLIRGMARNGSGEEYANG